MTATDDIRVLLGEHGMKCEIHDTKKRKDTKWDFRESSHAMFSEYRDGTTVFVMSGSLWTPEEAIAVTLEPGTCRKVRVHMQIEDEMHCSECGRFIGFVGDISAPPYYYCPNCGRKVLDE